MKASEIREGHCYRAQVQYKPTIVKVTMIGSKGRGKYYGVTDMATGLEHTFFSATRFYSEVLEHAPEPEVKNGLAAKLKANIQHQQSDGVHPHVIVAALAGTGKTTTLIEALKILKGGTSRLTPSPQQQAVWDIIALSSGVKSICFCAFNRSIAEELKGRVPAGVDAMTTHSLGNRAVFKRFGKLRIPKNDEWVVRERIAKVMGKDFEEVKKHHWDMMENVRKLVALCKQNLVMVPENECIMEYGDSASYTVDMSEELDKLCAYYEIELNGTRDQVYSLVPGVLNYCKNPNQDGMMDFNDMIWLPVVLKLHVFRYDLLLVDEAQDLNRCQQALVRMAGVRIILVGDTYQAIYGFAGADSESLSRMEKELGDTPAGCVVLPLTVTRRCGKAIVEEAKKIVPQFEAHESNGDGLVTVARFPQKVDDQGTYTDQVLDGDMVICRVNAPLISQCFRFIKAGRKAMIQGRDVGQGLLSTIKKMNATGVADLVEKLDKWLHAEIEKEYKKRNPSEIRIIGMQDRYDCIVCFTEGVDTVEKVNERIKGVFTDGKVCPKCGEQGNAQQQKCYKCNCQMVEVKGIKLSSIHRAKGLEADRVFFLMPKGGECPHPMAKSQWQRGQEMNLLYVGITRAINELVYVR